MWKEANALCWRLWKDESGLVLALTVVVFLTLFIMACSIYALGENIRQRIELQNAVDAAAYSAAVVQADALSRIAALNRAMGWTYIKVGRMTMDYIVDKWLERVYMLWRNDVHYAKAMAALSTCSSGAYTGSRDWYVGDGHGSLGKHVRLNRRVWVEGEEINRQRQLAAGQGKSWRALQPQIVAGNRAIDLMSAEEERIIRQLTGRIQRTVKTVLRRNTRPAGEEQMRFTVLHNDARDYFEVVQNEGDFLRFLFLSYTKPTDAKAFGPEGTDLWFRKVPRGIQRDYVQQSTALLAEWRWHYGIWHRIKKVCVRVAGDTQWAQPVKGEDVRDPHFTTTVAKPQWLRKAFFDKPGAIVVGVAREMSNPMRAFWNDAGIFAAFTPASKTPSAGGPWMWAVAAARAGYKDWGRGNGPGWYNPTIDPYYEWADANDPDPVHTWRLGGLPGWIMSPYNLSESDWDAVLIPLHRAWWRRIAAWWPRTRTHGFGGRQYAGYWDSSQGDVLSYLANRARWEPLWDGGGSSRGLPRALGEAAQEIYH